MNIQECNHIGKYLGHPFCQQKAKIEAYKVLDRLKNKLYGWKQKTLSIARRLVLVKVVA